jgi:hypothetical protein
MQAPQTTEQRSRAALVWGVDPVMGKAWLVDLYDASISPPLGIIADALSSNNTQSFQNGNTLYIILGLSAPPDEYPGKSRHEASEARARLRAALDGRGYWGDCGPDDCAGDGPYAPLADGEHLCLVRPLCHEDQNQPWATSTMGTSA